MAKPVTKNVWRLWRVSNRQNRAMFRRENQNPNMLLLNHGWRELTSMIASKYCSANLQPNISFNDQYQTINKATQSCDAIRRQLWLWK